MPNLSTPSAALGEDTLEPSAPAGQPHLRFYHSPELRAKTISVIGAMETAPDPTRHRKALADLVTELTDAGLSYYFLRALDLARVNFVIKQSAHLGISSVMRIMGPVVHNIIGMMDKQQLLVVCGHIRALME